MNRIEVLVAHARYERALMSRDPAEALSVFEDLTRRGHPGAQESLAQCFASGTGTPRDVERALVLWEQINTPEGNFRMGEVLLQEGRIQAALDALLKSARVFHPPALTLLGLMSIRGTHLRKDVWRGVQLLEVAAQQGSGVAQLELAKHLSRSEDKIDHQPAGLALDA